MTHPALLRAVVEKVEQMAPAEIVVGDNTGLFSYGDNENSFEKTGLMAAAGGHYRNLGDTPHPLAFHPDLREIGLILAADNAVALDGVVARMMGYLFLLSGDLSRKGDDTDVMEPGDCLNTAVFQGKTGVLLQGGERYGSYLLLVSCIHLIRWFQVSFQG